MELHKLVEEFLVLNERQKAGIATQRELARWRELHQRLSSWSTPGRELERTADKKKENA